MVNYLHIVKLVTYIVEKLLSNRKFVLIISSYRSGIGWLFHSSFHCFLFQCDISVVVS